MSQNFHIPPGTMMLWGGGAGQYAASANGAIAAPGWLYCDGQTVPQAMYRALFAAIGTRYNTTGEGVGTFRLPGISDYMIKHVAAKTNAEHVSRSAFHAHNISTVPGVNALASTSHNHNATASTTSDGGSHGHAFNVGTSANDTGNVLRASGSTNTHIQGHNHGMTGAVGAAGPHNHNISGGTSTPNHNHNAPTITYLSSGAGGGTTSHPTIAIWHIIKI